jgi:ABC-type Mn2+/Zn2+ transport system permease subunit
VTAAVLLLLATVALAFARDRILLWTIDPEGARVLGVRTARWDVAVGAAIGVATGFAIHAAGLLFTFGATVLPVLVARRLGRSLAGVLLLAPLLGLGATFAGLVAGHSWDLPPGQSAVAVMALLLAGASLAGRLRG